MLGHDNWIPNMDKHSVNLSGKYPVSEKNIQTMADKHATRDVGADDIYADTLDDAAIGMTPDVISAEFVPGESSDVLAKMINAPYEIKAQFTADIMEAISNPKTKKIIPLEEAGIEHTFETFPSAYVNDKGVLEINPAAQITLGANASRDDAEFAATMLGYLTKQEGVASYKPAYNAQRRPDAFKVDLDRQMTPDEIKGLHEAVEGFQKGGGEGIAIFPNETGVDIIHLGEGQLQGSWSPMDHKALTKTIEDYLKTLDGKQVVDYFTTGETLYKTNDWKGVPDGKDYSSVWKGYTPRSGKGGPDLQRRIQSGIGPRLDKAYTKWSEAGYGKTQKQAGVYGRVMGKAKKKRHQKSCAPIGAQLFYLTCFAS